MERCFSSRDRLGEENDKKTKFLVRQIGHKYLWGKSTKLSKYQENISKWVMSYFPCIDDLNRSHPKFVFRGK